MSYPVKLIYDKIDPSYGGNKYSWYAVAQAKRGLIQPAAKAFFIAKNLVAFIKKYDRF